MKKIRLDSYLVEHGFYPSRERAKAAIIEGDVTVDKMPALKPGKQIESSLDPEKIEIKKPLYPYVSRGGLKLEKGLEVFDFDPKEKTYLDIGASTGGFTDCLLQNGAAHVYAIDVGYGQLDYTLREDERVTVLERTNFRNIEKDKIPEKCDGSVMDVSFISITKLIEKIKSFLKEDAESIWLIKPQFEAGRDKVGKNGIIRDPKIHREVLEEILTKIQEAGFTVLGLDTSPIKGQKGNVEFLCYTKNRIPEETVDFREEIRALTNDE